MNESAWIFDMDGTLVDNMHWHNQAWLRTLGELGCALDEAPFFHWSAGRTNAEIFPVVLNRTLSDAEIAAYSNQKERAYRELSQGKLSPIAGLLPVLTTLAERGIKRAVATAAPPDNIQHVLDPLDLRRHFDAVVGAADVKRGKPDPEIFLKAAERVGANPAQCLAFEDAPNGLLSALNAGMQVIALTTTLSRDALLALPFADRLLAVIDDYSDPQLAPFLLGTSRA